MKHSQNNRRGRSRGGQGKRSSSPRHVYESNGPDVKVRGTPQQILDKYLTMARDAQSSGDRVLAESYLQFAEHYFRVLNVDGQNVARQGHNGQGQQGQQGQGGNTQTEGSEGGEASEERASTASASSKEEAPTPAASSEAEASGEEAAEKPKPKRTPRAKAKAKPKGKPRGRKAADEAAATA